MYPNLYYVFKNWFGVEWHWLSFLNTFGLMVAVAFLTAAWLLSQELKRKEKMGLLLPKEETIIVGKPASIIEMAINGMLGFFFGFKIIGLLFSKPVDINPQDYIFSSSGNALGGLLFAAVLIFLKWKEKNKVRLKEPEKRIIRIWPHDRVGDFVVLGLVFGILGAKLFDNLERWDEFIKDPIGNLFSNSGLTFYGGLIMASIAICWHAHRKGIKLSHLVDAAAPALIIAYAIGRIGCQVAGDGDWGIYNSAYVSDNQGNVRLAKSGEFEKMLHQDSTYFIGDKNTKGRYPDLKAVPHASFKGPGFLPTWLFAYSYPQNVNKDGIEMKGLENDEYNTVLPSPVFPTPIYETIMGTLIFIFLWTRRKKIKTPWTMFGIYLMLNGLERFTIELLRVNISYDVSGGISLTQAEIIAVFLIISGLGMIIWSRRNNSKALLQPQPENINS
jgi:phosphatidylglycerol:prolipoprotein diacylglycerol transferase